MKGLKRRMTDWLMRENAVKRDGILWNAVGGSLSAGQSAIILLFVSRRAGLAMAGTVALSYAVANLFLAIGKYGIRNFQVTDVRERFVFGDYWYGRVATVSAAGLFLLAYLFYGAITGQNTAGKTLLVLEITVLRLMEAFEDVYAGAYQQRGRLDVGAKIMALRLIASTGLTCALVAVSGNLYVSFLAAILLSILCDSLLLSLTYRNSALKIGSLCVNRVGRLLKKCFPLCIGTVLAIYIGNAPQYMIDRYMMDEEVQAIFGYLMIPVFGVMLLSNFIFQPMVRRFGDAWSQKRKKDFAGLIRRQSLIVLLLTVSAMALGLFAGLPVLSFLYRADLTPYRREFGMLLLGGGFYAWAFFLTVPLTTVDRSKSIAVGYAVSAGFALAFGKLFVKTRGMLGAAALYLGVNLVLVLVYVCALGIGVWDESQKGA